MSAIFGFFAVPLGYLMQGIYYLVQNYGVTIIIFTFIVRLIMLPLRIKQQKSTSRQQAYQPMIQEIQNKWKNDKKRQQEEMMKFQEENGIKMTAGCLPMLVDMLVMFSIIQVIYMPLTYILHLNQDAITAGIEAVRAASASNISDYTSQSYLIGSVLNGVQSVISAVSNVDPSAVSAIQGFNFNFLGLNLSVVPDFSFQNAGWQYMIFPVLSILTMFASQFIIMKTQATGQQQGKGMMWGMTIVMGVMFGSFAFTVPVGFSLYYTTSSVVTTVVQLLVRKIINPEKIKEQVLAEIEEKRKAKKEKKTLEIKDSQGNVVKKDVTESELIKLRLARARELDAAKYSDSELTKADTLAADKARKMDESRYGAGGEATEKPAEKASELANSDEDKASDWLDNEVREEKVLLRTDFSGEEEEKGMHKPGRRMKNRKKQKEKE